MGLVWFRGVVVTLRINHCMRNHCFPVFLFLVCVVNSSAQDNGIVISGKWADQVSITDINGRPFANRYNDIAGTPYFNAEYKTANIKLNQGRTFVNVRTRIDMVSQEAHFLSSNGIEGYIEAGMAKDISYADTTPGGIMFYKFQSGFPPVDRQNQNNFYQLLAEGKCSFVKSISKSISERKNELSGEIIKEFETSENYYLFIKGEMKRWKRNKESILDELTDKQVQVNQFVLLNKTNFKNPEQVSKLLNYYNTL